MSYLTSFALNLYVTVVTGEMAVYRSYVHLDFAFCDEFEGALVTSQKGEEKLGTEKHLFMLIAAISTLKVQ